MRIRGRLRRPAETPAYFFALRIGSPAFKLLIRAQAHNPLSYGAQGA
jgi:hypothetical protein